MSKPREVKRQRIVFWIILSILLILRIPLESWTEYLFPSTAVWIEPLYEFGSYLLIAFLIWWERKRLLLHHLDFLAVIIIIVFKPLSIALLPSLIGNSKYPNVFPQLFRFSLFIIALILLALILWKKINIGKPNCQAILWFVLSSITGLALSVFYGVMMIKWFDYPVLPNPGSIALIAPFFQLGYTAVIEEPVFRGFLWGGLRSLGLKEYWILLIQAFLFTIAHIHLLRTTQPILSFGVIFISGIIFGLFVWRSRSLSSSMAVHGFYNGSTIVQYWVYSFLFR